MLEAADIVFPDGSTPPYVGNPEGVFRDGASARTAFLDLDARCRVNGNVTVRTLLSATRGVGSTRRSMASRRPAPRAPRRPMVGASEWTGNQGLSTINGVPMPTAPTHANAVTTLAFPANVYVTKHVELAFSAT